MKHVSYIRLGTIDFLMGFDGIILQYPFNLYIPVTSSNLNTTSSSNEFMCYCL